MTISFFCTRLTELTDVHDHQVGLTESGALPRLIQFLGITLATSVAVALGRCIGGLGYPTGGGMEVEGYM